MRNSQAKKDENRRLILDAAARLFRERGIHGVSISDVMQAADMTHGGFYRHFADKDDLLAQALEAGRTGEDRPAVQDPITYALAYLSAEHRDHVGAGCAFAALGSEIVRGPAAARGVMTEAMRRQIESFAQSTAGRSEHERRQAAIGIWAAMIGALVLSRICDDPALAQEILDGTRAWVASGERRQGDGGTPPVSPPQSPA